MPPISQQVTCAVSSLKLSCAYLQPYIFICISPITTENPTTITDGTPASRFELKIPFLASETSEHDVFVVVDFSYLLFSRTISDKGLPPPTRSPPAPPPTKDTQDGTIIDGLRPVQTDENISQAILTAHDSHPTC